jgi:hypothetical protein
MAARLERDSVSLRQRVYCPEADIVARGGVLRAWIAQPDEEARRAHSRRVRPTEQDSYLGADSLNHGWVKHTVRGTSRKRNLPDEILWGISEAGMRCLSCGAEVAEGRQYCDRCAPLAGGAPTPSGASDALSKIIPYRNTPALIGYYFAVFSLIPCIGAPLAVVAIVLGVMGLRKAMEHPEAHGKAHAWIAIVLGGLMFVLQGACGLWFMATLRAAS